MKKNSLILFGLFFSFSLYAQDSLLIVERQLNQYYVETLYTQVDFAFTNKSTNNYVLWIEKDNVSSLSESERVRNYFFVKKGDASLMQIIWDGNVGSFVPALFDTFIKIIKPNEQFVVSIIVKGKVCNKSEKISLSEKQIQIIDTKKIRGFTVDAQTDFFNYKANNITVFDEWLNK